MTTIACDYRSRPAPTSLTGCSPKRRPHLRLSIRSIKRAAQEFEECPQRRKAQTYCQFVHTLRSVMHTHMVLDRQAAHKSWNPWWDREVKAAWRARRQANHEHRRAVRSLDVEASAAAWALYLEEKHKVQALVQSKIADHNLRIMQSIRSGGKSGPKSSGHTSDPWTELLPSPLLSWMRQRGGRSLSSANT